MKDTCFLWDIYFFILTLKILTYEKAEDFLKKDSKLQA